MNDYKISNLSFSFIFVCLLNSSLLGLAFPFLLNQVKTSVFISLFISFILGLLLLFIYFKVFNYQPDKNIFEKIDFVLPKFISKIFNILLMILILLAGVVIFWRLVTFASSEFLVETPDILIVLILSLPILYSLLYDFDTLARIATFTVFICFILYAFNIISLVSLVEFEKFKPLINNDFINLGKGSGVFIIIYLIPAFLTLMIPKNNVIKNESTKRYILISYIVSFLLLSLIFFVIIGVLGINIANIYTFPSYIVLKTLNVLSFIKNTENINILVWLLFMIFSCSFMLMTLKSGLYNLFKINKKKLNKWSILNIFIPFILISNYLLPFESHFNKYKYIYVPAFIYLSIFIILFILAFFSLFKRKNKE